MAITNALTFNADGSITCADNLCPACFTTHPSYAGHSVRRFSFDDNIASATVKSNAIGIATAKSMRVCAQLNAACPRVAPVTGSPAFCKSKAIWQACDTVRCVATR